MGLLDAAIYRIKVSLGFISTLNSLSLDNNQCNNFLINLLRNYLGLNAFQKFI